MQNQNQQVRNIAILGNIESGKVNMLNMLMKLAQNEYQVPPKDEIGMYIMKCNQFNYQNKQIKATYICSRGRLDFIDEISSILRVVDGAFVMINVLEGISVLVELVLEKCMKQRVQPVIVLNKIDSLIQYFNSNQQDIYKYLNELIDQINTILKRCDGFSCSIKDNFLFTSLKYEIIFNNKTFVNLIKNNENNESINQDDQKQKLVDLSEQQKQFQWISKGTVLTICQIIKSYFNNQNNNIVNKQLNKKQYQYSFHTLKKCIYKNLPSPQTAQKYRAQVIYTGDIIDVCGQGILKCSNQAPLMMYVTNTINDPDQNNVIYRLARIYSGILTKGDKVKIFDRKYKFGSKSNIFYGSIKQLMQPVNDNSVFLESAQAGSIVCITGVDHKIVRAATISTFDLAHPLAYIKSVQKRICCFIRCQPQNYSKMIEELKQLSKRRQGLRYSIQQTGEAFVLGSSIESLLAYIQEIKIKLNFQIKPSQPFIKVKESITKPSEQTVMSKSYNKQNRIYLKSQPLNDKLCQEIDSGQIKFFGDKQARNQKLVKKFEWNQDDAMRIWSFGPDQKGPNILVDKTQKVKFLYQSKQAIITGFNIATWHGSLVEQPMRGVKINAINFQFSDIKQKRLPGQITQAVRRAIYGCELISSPVLLQPIFLCEIMLKSQEQKLIQQLIKLSRGKIIKSHDIGYKKIIDAYIPGVEKKVFEDKFKNCSFSMEYFQSIYHHDQVIDNFSLEQGTPSHALLLNIRKTKGLELFIPNKHDYIDKL